MDSDASLGRLTDRLGRPLRDLRISVTDRCNFRCSYCMPKEVFDKRYDFLPHSSLLSFEEITRLARLFVAHGVQNSQFLEAFAQRDQGRRQTLGRVAGSSAVPSASKRQPSWPGPRQWMARRP